MSLHFIGIRDFPVLHRQFSSPNTKISSPNAKSFDSPNSTQDLARDSRDVLIQRLNDLAQQLTADEVLKDEDIAALHTDVDRMERALKRPAVAQHLQESFRDGKSPSSVSAWRDHEDDPFYGPFSPSRKVAMRFPDSPTSKAHSRLQKSLEMSPKNVDLLAKEAEALRVQLSVVVEELRARKEESSHIHDLLVTRAEEAAQRIITLESHVQDLDNDLETCQSELSFLRLQLRALEVQGLQYIPFDADEELSESITNWKLDWADVDQRTKARRRKCADALGGRLDESQTIVDSPR